MITIYGIPNCDTIKKTIDWFNQHQISFAFHDYKKQGISTATLNNWCKQVGWEILFNKRSTTWKALNSTTPISVNTEKEAIAIMTIHHSIIKRPVIEKDGKVVAVGFKADELAAALK